MPYEYRWKRRVEFAETDMAGIVHFSNFFRYMEMAEHEFLRSLGLSVHTRIDGKLVSWPRVRAECSFRAPVTFEDELEIHLLVREKRSKTITYECRCLRADRTLAAQGSMTVVCATVDPETGQMSAITIPKCIDEKIETAPAERLPPRATQPDR